MAKKPESKKGAKLQDLKKLPKKAAGDVKGGASGPLDGAYGGVRGGGPVVRR